MQNKKRKTNSGASKKSKQRTYISKAQTGYLRTGGLYGKFDPLIVGRPEKKYKDTVIAAAVIPVAGSCIAASGGSASLNVLVQDSSATGRVGRKVTLKNVYIHGAITLPSTGVNANATDIVRIILYIDKQTNGVTPAVADLLDTAVGGYNSFRNLSNVERYIILKDKFISVSAATTVAAVNTGVVSVEYKIYKKIECGIEFSGNTGAVTEVRSNNLCVLAISKNGLATNEFVSRVRFTDV